MAKILCPYCPQIIDESNTTCPYCGNKVGPNVQVLVNMEELASALHEVANAIQCGDVQSLRNLAASLSKEFSPSVVTKSSTEGRVTLVNVTEIGKKNEPE